MARRTSPIGMTPSFSPFFSFEKSANASRISVSSALLMLCSFASLESRTLGAAKGCAGAVAVARRLAGYSAISE